MTDGHVSGEALPGWKEETLPIAAMVYAPPREVLLLTCSPTELFQPYQWIVSEGAESFNLESVQIAGDEQLLIAKPMPLQVLHEMKLYMPNIAPGVQLLFRFRNTRDSSSCLTTWWKGFSQLKEKPAVQIASLSEREEKRSVALKVIQTLPEEWRAAPEDFTCFTCVDWKTCRSAWDPYNTDGDCLESK